MAKPALPEPKPRMLDTQNRVIIPPDVLAALGVGPGDYVAFRIEDDGIRFYRVEMTLKAKRP